VLAFDAAAPAFEGALTLARPAASGADAALPWRLTARLKATPAAAAFEQIEASYGPEDSAPALHRRGRCPLRRVAVPAPGAGGAAARCRPPARCRRPGAVDAGAAAHGGGAAGGAPLPAQIEIGAEQIALGGRSLQTIAVELRGDPSVWNVTKFELRAPGGTRIAATGAIASARFAGPLTLDAADPELLAAWLQAAAMRPTATRSRCACAARRPSRRTPSRSTI